MAPAVAELAEDGGGGDAGRGAGAGEGEGGRDEVMTVYARLPAKTMPAPEASRAFQPEPNHHTLKQRLMALRVVSTRFVDTDERRYMHRC
jgi:hypothetical protein